GVCAANPSVAADVSPQRRCHTRKHENSRAGCMLPPLTGERAEVRASVSSNLIFGVGGFGQGRNPNKAPAARCLRFSDIGFDSSFVIRISSFGDTTWTRERPARLNESLITLRGGQWEHLDSNPKEVCGIPSQAPPCRVEPGARESWPR